MMAWRPKLVRRYGRGKLLAAIALAAASLVLAALLVLGLLPLPRGPRPKLAALVTLDVEVEGRGSVLINGSKVGSLNLAPPALVALRAVPEEGWRLSKWLVNGSDYGSSPELELEVRGNTTVVAVFEEVRRASRAAPPPRPERCFLRIVGPEGYPVWVNGTEYRLPVVVEHSCSLTCFDLLANETYRLNETARYEFRAWRLGEKRVESRAAELRLAGKNSTLTLEAELIVERRAEPKRPKLKAVPAREAIDWSSIAPMEDEEELKRRGYLFEWWVKGYTVYANGILVKLPLKRTLN